MPAANNLDEHLQVVKNQASNASCPFEIEFHNFYISMALNCNELEWTSTYSKGLYVANPTWTSIIRGFI